jgi:hypothetical protein
VSRAYAERGCKFQNLAVCYQAERTEGGSGSVFRLTRVLHRPLEATRVTGQNKTELQIFLHIDAA